MQKRNLLYNFFLNGASRAWAQTRDCKRDRLWVRFKAMKYLIFSFLRSGVEAKRVIEFRQSTRNAFRIRRMVTSGVL